MEEAKNIIYSCEEHGLDVYREIKNNPRVPKTHIYCYFPPINEGNRQVHEKMWVKITKGNRKKGKGLLDNEPKHNYHYKLHQVVHFETDENDITRAI
tara:strand:+ start:1901 stop:2191 length:291 start_codon:yes stop_codon:yes gene_type:complete